MKHDLSNEAGILEWAQDQSELVEEGSGYLSHDVLRFTPDRETARMLARAVRITRVWDADEAKRGNTKMQIAQPWSHATIHALECAAAEPVEEE